MKTLIALILMVNCLGFFMLKHLQSLSASVETPAQQNTLDLPLAAHSLTLLSELSTPELAALVRAASEPPVVEGTDADSPLCDIIGPFSTEQHARDALAVLLPELLSADSSIFMVTEDQFILKLPLDVTASPTEALSELFIGKKRYQEPCMKVANMREFH